jgi:uncharacterized protein YaaR (DUF327 family)
VGVKINNVNRMDPGGYPTRGSSVRSASETDTLLFRRTLPDLSNEAYIARLHEIRKKIDEQGERLSDKADIKEYEKYRSLIRDFIDEIVSNGYTFSKEDSYASRGRHRYIATVEVVNKKLDELGKEVMQEQADKLEILSKIDDIRGLLLDMMM